MTEVHKAGSCRTIKASCSDCSLSSLCLPLAVQAEDLDRLDEIIKQGQRVEKGQHLFRSGDEFKAIYAVRTGAIKTYSITPSGEEQINGFYLPGEIMGMDGINTNHHVNSAKALESTTVCEVPFNRLEELTKVLPGLQRHFFQMMSKEIREEQQLIMLLAKKNAEERIASLLLSISTRNGRRRLSTTAFRLPMTRVEIGNYLGLAVETVSRVLTRFQKQGILAVESKEVRINDYQKLCQIATIQEG
ncbi:fumarate/nitrate reduction transcriptional regulator Fnr [Pelagibaculum spongiae]|uniref:Crp/Fnr family transcriptional regulator n=1 Tax=Pelagibaculum spongiae TaxID=2080658 RepID=A0A2V1H022_9GAMM|nr:fumarate/nitrate reduction transcriptional regulator Fnr [Pelagibaculum spongiae]PVZ70544.1 Crp/Fnr family transcriptional regulator [Pelagibaculum spongiae]